MLIIASILHLAFRSLFITYANILIVGKACWDAFDILQSLDFSRYTFSIQITVIIWLGVTKSSITPTSKCIHMTFLINYTRVNTSSKYFFDLEIDCLHLSRKRLVCCISMRPFIVVSQFTFISCSPSKNKALFTYSHAMTIFLASVTRYIYHFNIWQSLNLMRFF